MARQAERQTDPRTPSVDVGGRVRGEVRVADLLICQRDRGMHTRADLDFVPNVGLSTRIVPILEDFVVEGVVEQLEADRLRTARLLVNRVVVMADDELVAPEARRLLQLHVERTHRVAPRPCRSRPEHREWRCRRQVHATAGNRRERPHCSLLEAMVTRSSGERGSETPLMLEAENGLGGTEPIGQRGIRAGVDLPQNDGLQRIIAEDSRGRFGRARLGPHGIEAHEQVGASGQ